MSTTSVTSFTEQPSATQAIAKRVLSLGRDALAPETARVGKQCILDWFGVALNARHDPLVEILLDQATEDGAGKGASVLGRTGEFSPRQAALINGAMGHAIDYDDAHLAALGHATAAVLPGVLALAEQRHASGDALLRAFVAGYEAMAMAGLYVGQAHYDHGFHGTATVGAIGAAAACGVLLGQDAPTLARTLGIAATQAAGLKAQFGTMCKPLHAGKASENGLLAAQLANRGFSSRTDIFECTQGFGQTLGRGETPPDSLVKPDGVAHIRDTLFKFDAACYGTHAAIGAARRLQREHRLDAQEIEAATVTLESTLDRMCNIPKPASGLEAKFSVRFNVALALSGEDTASPDTYTDEITARPGLVQLRDRIEVVPAAPGSQRMASEVTVRLRDGRQFSACHDTSVPAQDLAAQGEQLLNKFLRLSTPAVGSEQAQHLAQSILNIESLKDVAALADFTR